MPVIGAYNSDLTGTVLPDAVVGSRKQENHRNGPYGTVAFARAKVGCRRQGLRLRPERCVEHDRPMQPTRCKLGREGYRIWQSKPDRATGGARVAVPSGCVVEI